MESKINLSFSTSLSKTALDSYVVWLFSLISLPVGPHPVNSCCQVYHLTELYYVIADQHYFKKIILAGLSTCFLLLPLFK